LPSIKRPIDLAILCYFSNQLYEGCKVWRKFPHAGAVLQIVTKWKKDKKLSFKISLVANLH